MRIWYDNNNVIEVLVNKCTNFNKCFGYEFVHLIPRPSMTLLLSYQILILNIDNIFNKDCRSLEDCFIAFSACVITPWNQNHTILSTILEGQNLSLICQFIVSSMNFFQNRHSFFCTLLYPGLNCIILLILGDQYYGHFFVYSLNKYLKKTVLSL